MLTGKCIISENGQTYFKNLATFDAGSSKCVWQIWSIIYQRVKCEQLFVHWVWMIQVMSDWLSDGSIYVKSFWKNFMVILPFKQYMKMCLRCSTCLFTIFRYLASSLKFANIKLRNSKCYKVVIANEGLDNCSEVMTDQHFWGLSV